MGNKGSHGEISYKNIKLFVEREDVKKVVKQIRSRRGIPDTGFTNKKDYLAWLDNLTGQLKSLKGSGIKTVTEYEFDFINDKPYLSSVTERKTLGIFGKISEYSLFLQDIVNACVYIIKKPPHWRFFLNRYITQNKIIPSLQFRSGRTHRTPTIKAVRIKTADGKELERKIRLEFGANTTEDDILSVWKKVIKIQKSMPEYEKEREKIDPRLAEFLIKHIRIETKFRDIYSQLSGKISVSTRDTVYKEYLRLKKFIKGQ